VILALLGGGNGVSRAASLEDAVIAAYLSKFCHYVEWPGKPVESLVIGVIGAEPVAGELDKIALNRAIVIRRLGPEDSLTGLNVLFIAGLGTRQVARLLERSRDLPILTVTDQPEASEQGSMVNFVRIDDRLRFTIALKPLAPSTIKVSALMMAAAYKVLPGTP
jgi:hypothetical protein